MQLLYVSLTNVPRYCLIWTQPLRNGRQSHQWEKWKIRAITSMTDTTTNTIRAIVKAKNEQDLNDYETIIAKRDSKKHSFAIQDIIDCNRLPLLKTRISTPGTASKAYNTYEFCRNWGMQEDAKLPSNSMSQLGSSSQVKSALGGAYRGLSIQQEKSRVIKTYAEHETENEKLARILQYMTDARQIVDSSRLYFEAAVSFQELEMFERASYCYKHATKRASAALVVDTYDLPEDEIYRRHIERMSRFNLPAFLAKRGQLRNNLIFEEEERQRLRARESHYQLVRIHLMTDLVDLAVAHNNIGLAFKCCSNEFEHRDMLLSMHVLLKEFASMKRRELPLIKQIERSTQGPIADAHLNILLELETSFPENADVHEWLGYRYTEKCDFDAAQFHFKKLRDILDPLPDMADTLLVWGSSFKIPVTAADDPIQIALEEEIKANICKTPFGYISLEGQKEKKVSDTDKAINDMAAKLKQRQDRQRSHVSNNNTPLSQSNSIQGNLGSDLENDQAIEGLLKPPFPQSTTNRNSAVVSSSSSTRPPFNAMSLLPNVVATQPAPVVPAQTTIKPDTEHRDLAWFGGVHQDCNTILYKAPLQGWNTLLPSTAQSKARNAPKKST